MGKERIALSVRGHATAPNLSHISVLGVRRSGHDGNVWILPTLEGNLDGPYIECRWVFS